MRENQTTETTVRLNKFLSEAGSVQKGGGPSD